MGELESFLPQVAWGFGDLGDEHPPVKFFRGDRRRGGTKRLTQEIRLLWLLGGTCETGKDCGAFRRELLLLGILDPSA